jgi:hypothetical protein
MAACFTASKQKPECKREQDETHGLCNLISEMTSLLFATFTKSHSKAKKGELHRVQKPRDRMLGRYKVYLLQQLSCPIIISLMEQFSALALVSVFEGYLNICPKHPLCSWEKRQKDPILECWKLKRW